jgi:hypothetical protein
MLLWWQTSDDEEVWVNFENMLFSEQRRKDQVLQFHTYAEYV